MIRFSLYMLCIQVSVYFFAFLTENSIVSPMQTVSKNNSVYIYNFMGGIPMGVFDVPEL